MTKTKILIAIDDSVHAKTLVHGTYNLADIKNSEITLLNVIETTVAEENYFYSAPEKFIEHESDKSDFAYLENFLENSEVDYKGFIYKEGNAAEVIKGVIKDGGYNLAVIGSHNRSPIEKLLPGSTAYKITRTAKCSVLVINNNYHIETHKSKPFSVSACVDISDNSFYMSENLGKFIDKDRAEVNLLHVTLQPSLMVPPDAYIYIDLDKIIRAADAAAEDFLGQIAGNLEKTSVKVVKKYRIEGDAASVIIDEAEKKKNDLIVVSSHGAGGFSRLFLGSVSTKVYEHANIPVLIIKASNSHIKKQT